MAREQFMISVAYIVDDAARADFCALGVWVRLCAYCAPRLLGGRLKGAQAWADGVCMRALGMTRSALDEVVAAELAWWDGADLILGGYDLAGERIWKKKSKGGQLGGKNSAAAYSSRVSSATSLPDSPQDSSKDSLEGVVQRDSDSDSDSDGDSEQRGDALAREGLSDGDAPALLAAAAAGAWLIDRKSGEKLHAQWLEALNGLESPVIAQVFANAKRLTTHEIRYPSGFSKALDAWRTEKRKAAANRRAADDQRVIDERRAQETANAEAARSRSREQVAMVDAFLGSADGAFTAGQIEANPDHAKRLAMARRHAVGGAGANLALVALSRDYPDLRALLATNPTTGEGIPS